MAVAGWGWAALIVSSRHHLIESYAVVPTVPPGWGVWAAPVPSMWFVLVACGLLAWGCLRAAQSPGGAHRPAVLWLASALAIPALDLARVFAPGLPVTFVEPLLLALVTGLAAERLWLGIGTGVPAEGRGMPAWFLAVALAATATAGWFYAQSRTFYEEFVLGYNDFGHFAARVVATWEGRGFLLEAPGLPPFWDHCNPGLALLAPLWGLCPRVELFFAIQAICLAAPAVLVYGLAREAGSPKPAAACWAWGYLCFPAVSQLNLSFSYGWHPVSCALPCLFAGLWLLARGRRVLAWGVALLACSFEETVVVAVAMFCGAMAAAAWGSGRRSSGQPSRAAFLSRSLSARGWTLATCSFLALFLLEYRFAGFGPFQVGRFQSLGRTPIEILLSPVLRPRAFWCEVLSLRSGYFVLALALPLGFRRLARGAAVLVALAVPVTLVIAWDRVAAKCIAFQYPTTWLPFLFAAGLAGVERTNPEAGGPAAEKGLANAWLTSGLAVLAACSTASLAIGAMPWSSQTLRGMLARNFPVVDGRTMIEERYVGSPRNQHLHGVVARVRQAKAVLATGRIAAHLLGVPRLETVGQAVERWNLLQAERDGSHRGLARFDWIVIDTYEGFQQQPSDVQFILDKARGAFRLEDDRFGVLVLRRAGS